MKTINREKIFDMAARAPWITAFLYGLYCAAAGCGFSIAFAPLHSYYGLAGFLLGAAGTILCLFPFCIASIVYMAVSAVKNHRENRRRKQISEKERSL